MFVENSTNLVLTIENNLEPNPRPSNRSPADNQPLSSKSNYYLLLPVLVVWIKWDALPARSTVDVTIPRTIILLIALFLTQTANIGLPIDP
jgi:hypothetical protein